jgi:hypothetical protein
MALQASETDRMDDSPPSKRRLFFRFSLRTLLEMMLVTELTIYVPDASATTH